MKTIRTGAGSVVLLLLFLTQFLLSGCSPVAGVERDLSGTAVLSDWYTYGTFLRLEGKAVLDGENGDTKADSVSGVELLLRSGRGEGDVTAIDLPFSVSKKTLTFQSAKKLDEGLCLETLKSGRTAVLLRLTLKDGGTRLLALSDGSGKGEDPADTLEYYTLPHRHGHRRVTASFEPVGATETLVFHVRRARLPADVYDIVVDPGHGGKDPGAQSGSLREADVVLELGKRLEHTLDRAGYKVLLTRDGTEDPNVNMAYTEYDPDGRVNRTCASRAKLCLSLHLNQNRNAAQNGVQIYRAKQAGNAFASALAEELVASTDLAFSTMGGRTADGVYVRTFTSGELRQERARARQKGYTFYDATTATDYFFMIREYGCRATGAYVDGRNPRYGTNEYRDSRQGVESCLCELGFLSNEHDRQILQYDQRSIASALTDAVDAYIASLYEAETAEPQRADLLAKESV